MIDYGVAAAQATYFLQNRALTGGKPIILVGAEADRRATLTAISADASLNPLNLGIELSQALIEAGGTRRDLSTVIAEMQPADPILLLDRIQILMLPQLNVNALDVLVRVARRRPVCASWPGWLVNGRLRYANPDHPEYIDDDGARALLVHTSNLESTGQ